MLPHFMDRAHLLSRFFLLITCAGWSARSAVPPGQVEQQPSVPAQRPVAPGTQREAEFSTANTVSIRADSQERDKTVYHLRGHVKVTYKEMKVTADERRSTKTRRRFRRAATSSSRILTATSRRTRPITTCVQTTVAS